MSVEKLAEHTLEQWQSVAQCELNSAETGLFVDGDYRDAIDGGRFDTINPANREMLATMSAANQKDVDAAVAAARSAFRSGSWSRMAPRDRMQVLYRYAELIEENTEQLAVLDSLDMGKPISDMLEVDIPSVIETIQFMAAYIDKIEGSVTNTESGNARDKCIESLLSYTQSKSAWIRLSE
jgi:acyl-CoA reductase-like NAD-dependent aldehyde dehydrogenase